MSHELPPFPETPSDIDETAESKRGLPPYPEPGYSGITTTSAPLSTAGPVLVPRCLKIVQPLCLARPHPLYSTTDLMTLHLAAPSSLMPHARPSLHTQMFHICHINISHMTHPSKLTTLTLNSRHIAQVYVSHLTYSRLQCRYMVCSLRN